MSENLDLVRSIYADWERGDYSSAEWADPEIEYLFVDGPSPGSWTGLAEMAKALRDTLSAWEDIRVEADEFRDLDGERVLVLHHFSGRGKASGRELGQMRSQGAYLFYLRDGKVTKLVGYWERGRARADLGLERAMSEESTTRDPVALSRTYIEAWNRGDVETAMNLYAPDAVYESVGLGTSFRGRTAIRGFLEEIAGSYEGVEMLEKEALDLGRGVAFGVRPAERSSRRQHGSRRLPDRARRRLGRRPDRAGDRQHRPRRGPYRRRTAR
jgi:ketosteroid isomerase-like protein